MKKIIKVEEVAHDDYVVYCDTDSNYFSMLPLFFIDGSLKTDEEKKMFCIKSLSEITDKINELYKILMVRMFNSTDNRIRIAADVVASSAFWIVKKRYAMWKVYDMEKKKDLDKMEVKGLDVVRSSYPKKFQDFMKSVLSDILKGTTNDELNKKILTFKRTIKTFNLEDIAKNTSVRFAGKKEPFTNFDPRDRHLFNFIKGAPAQCKAALAYNDMLKHHDIKTTEPIMSGGKIKWAYLRINPFGLDGIAFKDDGHDPKIVMDFINTYIDRTKIWNAELEKKLVDFYIALKWELYNEDIEKINKFFTEE